jgi:hypothetical protein
MSPGEDVLPGEGMLPGEGVLPGEDGILGEDGIPGECGPSGQPGSGASGEQENRQPATTSTGGSTAVSARTAVDFAVPFSPRTSTPPIAGETAFKISASRMSSIATTALNGN